MTNKAFEHQGEWWLPNRPTQRIKGTLRFTPKEGGILRLLTFQKDAVNTEDFQEPFVILGVLRDGKKATLYRCLTKRVIMHHVFADQTETTELTLHVHTILIGTHFQKTEDIKFDSVFVRFRNLDAWVNVSSFKIDFVENGASIQYQRPEDCLFNISGELKLCITYSTKYPTVSSVQKEACISQKAWIDLIPSKPKQLDDYWNIIRNLQNFLVLATTSTVYPLSINGRIKVNAKPDIIVEIFRLIGTMEPSKSLGPHEMLFTFKDISRQFDTLLANWFSKSETLEPFFDLFFGTFYVSEIFMTTEFLNYVQALESYHRRTKIGFELPVDQHKKRLESILAATPIEYKEWLSEKLKYSNEANLRKRLKEILETFPASFEPILGDRKKLVNDVCVTRNYLTHYDSELKIQAARDMELFKLTSRIKLLLQFCMLNELGFDPQYVEKLTARLIGMRYEYLHH